MNVKKNLKNIDDMPNSIEEFIKSDNPLSDGAIEFLKAYREEDTLVDYKETFHDEERSWLEISKDLLAFANTLGGYLIFGVKDRTFEIEGLDEQSLRIVSDANMIMQKINRYIEPHIQSIRCKHFKVDSKDLVAVFVPPSFDKTHIISRDGAFNYPSGKGKKIVLKQGTSYVRRSAGNNLMDARDLDDIIGRRIDHFKSSLLGKISRVVEAPQTSEVFIVSQDPSDESHRKFIVEDSPDAIPVKGMSFSISPKTIEQEITAWIALAKGDAKALPDISIAWKWYKQRKSIKLGNGHSLEVAKVCMLRGTPAFYWLNGYGAHEIKEMLRDALSICQDINIVTNIVCIGAFLGKKFHQSLIRGLGNHSKRLAPAKLSIPGSGPRSFFANDSFQKKSGVFRVEHNHEELEKELDQIAEDAQNQRLGLQNIWRAKALDCFLYARDDKYSNN